LSDWLELRIWRNQKEHFIRFANGEFFAERHEAIMNRSLHQVKEGSFSKYD
jgi:DNA gyrase/topoisomerase IV subunit B